MAFPRLLRWALVAPFAIFAAMYLLAMAGVQMGGDPALKVVGLVLWIAAGLAALVAVPVALFLLLRGGPYVTKGNVALTLLGGIPVLIVVAVAFVLVFGHFHI